MSEEENNNPINVPEIEVEDQLLEEPPEIGPPAAQRRGSGRPIFDRTGQRGRPRKLFRMINDEAMIETEFAFSSEIPIRKAVSGPDSDEWLDAMEDELKSIKQNKTWKIIDRPINVEVIERRIVLRNKFGPDGIIEKIKARLIARGFAQRPGIHFNQTLLLWPVKLNSAADGSCCSSRYEDTSSGHHYRLLQWQTRRRNLPGTARFYHRRFENSNQKGRTEHESPRRSNKNYRGVEQRRSSFRLKKSLYGLKQAGRNWHAMLDESLRRLGEFQQTSIHAFTLSRMKKIQPI